MWVYNLKGDIQLENGNKDTSVIVFGEKKLLCKHANLRQEGFMRRWQQITVVVVMFRVCRKIKHSVDW